MQQLTSQHIVSTADSSSQAQTGSRARCVSESVTHRGKDEGRPSGGTCSCLAQQVQPSGAVPASGPGQHGSGGGGLDIPTSGLT